eukprot:scaffold26555_cov38-Phaeocystis_antarctica.AAC.1
MAEKPNLTTANHSNLQDHLTPTPTTTTLHLKYRPISPPPHYTIISFRRADARRAAHGGARAAGRQPQPRKAPGGCAAGIHEQGPCLGAAWR